MQNITKIWLLIIATTISLPFFARPKMAVDLEKIITKSSDPVELCMVYNLLGYSRSQTLIQSVKDQKDVLDWDISMARDVSKSRAKMLKLRDLITQQTLLEIAKEVGNHRVINTLQKHAKLYRQEKLAKYSAMQKL